MDDTTTRVVRDLVETLEDGREGFTQAADKLREDGRTDLASQFEQFAAQRAQFADELRRHSPDTDVDGGTVAGALHRGWLKLRDALSGDDEHAVLAAAEQGEDHAVSEYEKALEEDLSADVRTIVQRQAREVRQAHDTVRALRDSAA